MLEVQWLTEAGSVTVPDPPLACTGREKPPMATRPAFGPLFGNNVSERSLPAHKTGLHRRSSQLPSELHPTVRPDEVVVTEVEGERTTVFELRVGDGDLGKVIGKRGQTAKSIRTLLGAASAKTGKRAVLEILE